MRFTISFAALLLTVLSASPVRGDEPTPPPLGRAELAFGCDLYRALSSQDGNLCVSPYSIGCTLAMARAGALGETATQIDSVLHAEGDASTEYGHLGEALRVPVDATFELSLANALWVRKGGRVKASFRDLVRKVHRSEVAEFDPSDLAGARRALDAWAAHNTKDRIPTISNERVPGADTQVLLANAVYFKASWEQEFSPELTKTAPFTLQLGKDVRTPLMKIRARSRVADFGDVQVLELPYVGVQTSMLIVLPRRRDGLREVERELSGERMSRWAEQLRYALVEATLPKFAFTKSSNLREVLKSLGMTAAFDGGRADFTGIREPDLDRLYLGQALHKVFVSVDEKGTEAAAVTALEGPTTGPPLESKPILFTADHPFLFVILHRATGVALFMGRVADPTRRD